MTNVHPPRELATERLRLDAVVPTDADDVLEYCSDPTLQQFVPVPVPYTRETAEGYTAGYAAKAPMLWAMRGHDDDRLLGVIELIPAPLASAELGYWLGSAHRGANLLNCRIMHVSRKRERYQPLRKVRRRSRLFMLGQVLNADALQDSGNGVIYPR